MKKFEFTNEYAKQLKLEIDKAIAMTASTKKVKSNYGVEIYVDRKLSPKFSCSNLGPESDGDIHLYQQGLKKLAFCDEYNANNHTQEEIDRKKDSFMDYCFSGLKEYCGMESIKFVDLTNNLGQPLPRPTRKVLFDGSELYMELEFINNKKTPYMVALSANGDSAELVKYTLSNFSFEWRDQSMGKGYNWWGNLYLKSKSEGIASFKKAAKALRPLFSLSKQELKKAVHSVIAYSDIQTRAYPDICKNQMKIVVCLPENIHHETAINALQNIDKRIKWKVKPTRRGSTIVAVFGDAKADNAKWKVTHFWAKDIILGKRNSNGEPLQKNKAKKSINTIDINDIFNITISGIKLNEEQVKRLFAEKSVKLGSTKHNSKECIVFAKIENKRLDITYVEKKSKQVRKTVILKQNRKI